MCVCLKPTQRAEGAAGAPVVGGQCGAGHGQGQSRDALPHGAGWLPAVSALRLPTSTARSQRCRPHGGTAQREPGPELTRDPDTVWNLPEPLLTHVQRVRESVPVGEGQEIPGPI